MDNEDATQLVRAHLDAIAAIVRERPVAVSQLRAEAESLLVYLTSPAGRTDTNCCAVDSALMSDDELWTNCVRPVHDELALCYPSRLRPVRWRAAARLLLEATDDHK